MGYQDAVEKAWSDLGKIEKQKACIKFLNDEYEVDFDKKKILSASCNIEAKDYYKILILHYLANEDKVSNIEGDDWKSFKEMEGGQVYFSAFRKRSIEPILRKYGESPLSIFERAKSFDAEKINTGSAGVSIRVFPKVKIGIILWARDEEFEPDCNVVFNRSIDRIFPTEDIAVLGGILASTL